MDLGVRVRCLVERIHTRTCWSSRMATRACSSAAAKARCARQNYPTGRGAYPATGPSTFLWCVPLLLHVLATPAAHAREVGSRLAQRTEAIGAVGNVILAHLHWADSRLK